jgi:hypothetical protein
MPFRLTPAPFRTGTIVLRGLKARGPTRDATDALVRRYRAARCAVSGRARVLGST